MTPEEIRETLFRTLDMVDRQWQEKQASKETCDKEREEHKLEVALLKNQLDLKDKALTEKDKALSESNRRIAELEKALAEKTAENVDAHHNIFTKNPSPDPIGQLPKARSCPVQQALACCPLPATINFDQDE